MTSRVAAAFILVGGFVAAASPAAATTITFTATTAGCFDKNSLSCTPTQTATLDDLTFTGGNDTDSLIYPPNTTISPFDLGTFSVSRTTGSSANIMPNPDSYFDLLVTFTLPSLGSNTYEAALIGQITGGNHDTFTIDFSQTPLTFNFSDGNGSGTFDLTVLNDPTFTWIGSQSDGHYDQASVPLNGEITLTQYSAINPGGDPLAVSAVPEPATLVMLGTGLLGLAKVRNRRRK